MSDLTIGDVGVTFQVQLLGTDLSQNPPTSVPLDLTNAQKIELMFLITNPQSFFQPPSNTVLMGIVGSPINGTVFYDFQPGDLVKPANMSKDGVFKYSIKVTFNNGDVLHTSLDGQLTIKDDSVL